jgi:hypothetical protein
MPTIEAKNAVAEITKPLRIKPSTAAAMLGIGYKAMIELIHTGIFTVFDNHKRGTKRRIHLLTEEVELYAREGEDALREHRAKKRKAKR